MAAEDNPEVFFHTFERVATVAAWPRDQWALVLTPCLTGLAQEVVEALDLGKAADYDKVKQAVLGTLNLSAETYRKQFRELRLKPGMQPKDVAQKMKANAVRWLKPASHSADQVVELVVLEQLVSTLGSTLRTWVSHYQPLTLESAITLLEAYWEAGESLGVAFPPKEMGEEGEKGPWAEMEEDVAARLERGLCVDIEEDIPLPAGRLWHLSKTLKAFPTASLPLDMEEGAISKAEGGGGKEMGLPRSEKGGERTLPPARVWSPLFWKRKDQREKQNLESTGREHPTGETGSAREKERARIEEEKESEGKPQAEGYKHGVEGRGTEEAGGTEAKQKEERVLPEGWEWIKLENRWTGEWEKLMIPPEEAERRRREKVLPKPSYWGERERRERRKREQVLAQERAAKGEWKQGGRGTRLRETHSRSEHRARGNLGGSQRGAKA